MLTDRFSYLFGARRCCVAMSFYHGTHDSTAIMHHHPAVRYLNLSLNLKAPFEISTDVATKFFSAQAAWSASSCDLVVGCFSVALACVKRGQIFTVRLLTLSPHHCRLSWLQYP